MGAGLGGGSSDAVCMLKLMNVLWDLNLTDEEGLELAAQLGSDCPFFWFSQPSLVTGRGEHLSKMEVGFPGPLYVTIIHPGIHYSHQDRILRHPTPTLRHGLERVISSPYRGMAAHPAQ